MAPDDIRSINSGFNGSMLFRQEFLFWAVTAALLLVYLWSPSLQSSELLFAESAREMAARGGYFHRVFNFAVTYAPPHFPGMWGCALFIKLFGNTEMAVRLPSVLAALGTLYVFRSLGSTLFNEKSAAIACWMLLGSAGFLIWGRSASAEMAGTMTVLLAVTWFLKLEHHRTFAFYLFFYLLCFGSSFIKGFSAPFMVLLILLPVIFSEKKWKDHLRWNHLAAFFTGVCLYLATLYLIPILSGGTLSAEGTESLFARGVREEAVIWYRQLFNLKENWYKGLREMVICLLPWIFFLPLGITGFLKSRREFSQRNSRIFAAVCCTFVLYLFIFSGSPADMFPLVPFILLFCAAGFSSRVTQDWNRLFFTAAWYLCIVLASLALCSIITYPLWDKVADYVPPAALVFGPVAAGVICWWALFMDHTENSSFSRLMGFPHFFCSVLFSGTILSGCFLTVVLPAYFSECNTGKRFFPEFRQKALESLPAGMPLRIMTYRTTVPAGYLFYNNISAPVERISDVGELVKKYPGERIILLMKNRKELLDQFDRECRKYNIVTGKALLSEKNVRWTPSADRNDRFVSYSVDMPSKKLR